MSAAAAVMSGLLRALLAAAAGAVAGWGMWLLLVLVLDATVGTSCQTTCPLLPGGTGPCPKLTAGCPLSPAHLAATSGSAAVGLLAGAVSLRYLRGGRR